MIRGEAAGTAWAVQLARRLVEARSFAGPEDSALSQAEAARAAGMLRSQLALYEAGVRLPSLHAMRDLAIGLGVSVDALLGLGECFECGRTVEESRAASHCALVEERA